MVFSQKFCRGFTIMDGEVFTTYESLYFLAKVGDSIFAKAEPLGKLHRDLPTSAYDAAILEFQKRNGDLSNVEDSD